MEPPQGKKKMGTWTSSVYTAEQQKVLGIDEYGNPIKSVKPVVKSNTKVEKQEEEEEQERENDGHNNVDVDQHLAIRNQRIGKVKVDPIYVSAPMTLNLNMNMKDMNMKDMKEGMVGLKPNIVPPTQPMDPPGPLLPGLVPVLGTLPIRVNPTLTSTTTSGPVVPVPKDSKDSD